MIQYLKGTLTYKSPVAAIIETGGIGWELKIPVSTFEALPETGSQCTLLAFLYLSQDDVRLYGFYTAAERDAFLLITKVNGIGPKIALSIISTLSLSAFVRAVDSGEEGLLSKVPGIGKKSAQRIIVELKDKLGQLMEHVGKDFLPADGNVSQVESALVSLGFNLQQIRRELSMMGNEVNQLSTEELIKQVIKKLYQRNK